MGAMGTLPQSIGNLVLLEKLHLGDNMFLGNIPSSVRQLSLLMELDLSFNGFSGNIPELPGGLLLLDLHENRLRGTIKISNLVALTVLDLSSNSFIGSIPSQIGTLYGLTILKLNNNYLSGTIPSQFNQLNMLQVLDISNNLLCGGCFNFSNAVSCDIGDVQTECGCNFPSRCNITTSCVQQLLCDPLSPVPITPYQPSNNTPSGIPPSPAPSSQAFCSHTECYITGSHSIDGSLLTAPVVYVDNGILNITGEVSISSLKITNSKVIITSSYTRNNGSVVLDNSSLVIERNMVFVNSTLYFKSLSSKLLVNGNVNLSNTILKVDVNVDVYPPNTSFLLISSPNSNITLWPKIDNQNCAIQIQESKSVFSINLDKSSCSNNNNLNAVLGGAIGGFILIVICVGIIICIYQRRKSGNQLSGLAIKPSD
eukprot:TRINITY_DN14337_c0_g1_i1.p1 TRINITY_DN14337_c0_g1~~TRINITY_DN14337_c0_g1_i1.p1  ORF type:complete len:489 (+),score=100.10 TRINITY_DN14337_c0_g1_i1:192-1469(+)